MIKLTRYSGSKNRLLKYLPAPPSDTKRLVELYGGSLAWSLNGTLPWIAYEVNPSILAMYEWLRRDGEELQRLNLPSIKTDIRNLGLPLGLQTYLQLNICSVVLGQLSSWTIYPCHNLPIKQTLKALPRLRQGTIIGSDCKEYVYQDGDFVFLDPPYVNTKANYKAGEKDYHPSQTIDLIKRIPSGRWMMTYSSIPDDFLSLSHRELCHMKVPNIRKGGTIERIEYLFTQ